MLHRNSCFELGCVVKDWSFSLVSRRGNNAAYFVAAYVMRSMVPQGWLVSWEILMQDRGDVSNIEEYDVELV